MDKEFVIPAEKVRVLQDKLSHIERLFKDVQVHILDLNRDTGSQWVRLSCSISSKPANDELEKAKEYINALCDSQASRVLVEIDENPAFRIQQQVFNLEKMFAVVVSVDDNLRKLAIEGSEVNVALAESWIDATLPKENQEVDLVVTDGSLNPSLKEFALKLGYSEKDVNTVAKKFNFNVDQNKLLRELINYTGTSRSDPKVDVTPRGPVNEIKTGQIVARGARSVSCSAEQGVVETQTRDVPRSAGAFLARGTSPSTPSIGTQGLNSCEGSHNSLLPIVIDGSNVAMNHGNQRVFSCRGIELCVNWFKERGHKEIYAFVPLWRTETPRADYPITDQHILRKLAKQNFVKFTPSRRVSGRNIVCYDDRYIVDLAHKIGGVIVSNDNYRDLQRENPEWKDVIEDRLLMYSFVCDYFMPPDDPLGKHGPTLKEFLRKGIKSHPKICPHISRCTYGSKCRYYHPERDPKRRQELMSGHQQQFGRDLCDTRNQRSTKDATPKDLPRQQRPWPSPYAITTRQHYTYSAPYNSYNNSSFPSNENIENYDQHYELVIEKIKSILGENKENFERAMQRLPSVYKSTKNVELIVNILLNEDL